MTVYEAVGGAAIFEKLVERFYDGVETDPILRPMYPADLTASRRHLGLFLIQYFGGPSTYSDERGHPRLRMRHLPFPIDQSARNAWIRLMSAALATLDLPEPARAEIQSYFDRAATFMINRPVNLRPNLGRGDR